jgi:hypothetical protein
VSAPGTAKPRFTGSMIHEEWVATMAVPFCWPAGANRFILKKSGNSFL